MTGLSLSEAVSLRVEELMAERNLTQYRLYKLSGVAQTTIGDIRLRRNKSVSLSIIYEIAQGLDMSLYEFFDSPLFKGDNITD
jgi:transcriptional regulator, cro/CI family